VAGEAEWTSVPTLPGARMVVTPGLSPTRPTALGRDGEVEREPDSRSQVGQIPLGRL
jgi:hypothetical protein